MLTHERVERLLTVKEAQLHIAKHHSVPDDEVALWVPLRVRILPLMIAFGTALKFVAREGCVYAG